jgi:hypothetical protein
MTALALGRQTRLFLVGFVLLAGCSRAKEFSSEDFKKIEKGMTEAQVEEVLGPPKESIEVMGIKRSFWQVGDNYYSISFHDGKVNAPLGPFDRQEYERFRALGEQLKKAGK